MKSNTPEGVKVDLLREFRIFELLPDWVRAIIREADDNVHVEPLARLYMTMKHQNLSKQYMAYEIRKACRHKERN